MAIDSDDIRPSASAGQSMEIYNPSGCTLPFKAVKLKKILAGIEQAESVQFSLLEVVFVDENGIIQLNKKHLGRDYVTDILSFRYDDKGDNRSIEGTLYCCAPRIAEQSAEYGTGQEEEYYRVFIHGILHLIGYDDQSDEGRASMTELENRYLGFQALT